MKKNFKILSVLLLSSLTLGCQDNKPKDGGELVQQAAILYNYVGSTYNQANAFNVNTIDLEETDIDPVQKNFKIEFVKPVSEQTDVMLSISDDAAKQYIKTTRMSYPILPKELIKLPDTIRVNKGEMSTPELTLTVNIDNNKIKLNTKYVFALTLDKAFNKNNSNINIFKSNNTIVYTIIRREKSVDIIKVASINRDVYFKPEKSFPYNLSNGMTMECLINVGKFRGAPGDGGDAGISTLIGIEGKCLLRFGDAGVAPNMLQACGEKVPFKFSTNKWYHIAAVFTPTNQLMIYVDGNKVAEYSNKRPVLYSPSWYIARSFNGNRGIVAKFSEVRIWSTARSQTDIQNNMYRVEPTSSDLLAYWKMDKAEGSKIIDATGHSYDLVQRDQSTNSPTEVTIETLPSALEIE